MKAIQPKDSKGHQLFSVPNTDEGKAFLKQMKRFLNPIYQYKTRGRGERSIYGDMHKRNFDGYLPHAFAKWLAVYITTPCKFCGEWMDLYHKERQKTKDLQVELQKIKGKDVLIACQSQKIEELQFQAKCNIAYQNEIRTLRDKVAAHDKEVRAALANAKISWEETNIRQANTIENIGIENRNLRSKIALMKEVISFIIDRSQPQP